MAYEIIEDIYSEESIQRIWNKGIVVDGYNGDLYRKDFAGAWISRKEYGNTNSILGWEIDHVYPEAKGGGNHEVNLRPMNWYNNRSKGDDYPGYTASLVSEGNRNVFTEVHKTVNISLQQVLSEVYCS